MRFVPATIPALAVLFAIHMAVHSAEPARAMPTAGVVRLAYEPFSPDDEEAAAVETLLRENCIGDEVARVINQLRCLPHDVTIRFGTEEGPQYAPALPASPDHPATPAEIHFPYGFVTEIRRIFLRNGYAERGQALDQATLDAVQHTLFHELGHALIDMLHIDVGKDEEDAVDSLATILLIESFDNGGDIALSAADAFSFLATEEALLSEATEQTEEAEQAEQPEQAEQAAPDANIPPAKTTAPDDDAGYSNFAKAMDEHSLNVHRYEAIACLIYGSAPDRYGFIAEDLALSDQDASHCAQRYAEETEYWFARLQP